MPVGLRLIVVIPGLTRNPGFSIWIPGGVYPLLLIRGGNDGFGTYVKKCCEYYIRGGETKKNAKAAMGKKD